METFSALLALCAGNSPVPVNSPHKGQWRGTLMFSLIYAWINDWVNNREAGDLRRHRGHYDVIVMPHKNRPANACIRTVLNRQLTRWSPSRYIAVRFSLLIIVRRGGGVSDIFRGSTRRGRDKNGRHYPDFFKLYDFLVSDIFRGSTRRGRDKNGRHYPDFFKLYDFLVSILRYFNVWFSSKFIPRGPVNNTTP